MDTPDELAAKLRNMAPKLYGYSLESHERFCGTLMLRAAYEIDDLQKTIMSLTQKWFFVEDDTPISVVNKVFAFCADGSTRYCHYEGGDVKKWYDLTNNKELGVDEDGDTSVLCWTPTPTPPIVFFDKRELNSGERMVIRSLFDPNNQTDEIVRLREMIASTIDVPVEIAFRRAMKKEDPND